METVDVAWAASRREYYPLRLIDVAAIVTFWAFLAFVSALGRELDPRIPDLARGIVSALVAATFVEYGLWALITMPVWFFASRFSVERGHRARRVVFFLALGIVIALAMDGTLRHLREHFLPPLAARRMHRRPAVPLLEGLGILDDLMVYLAVLGSGVARDYLLRYRTRLSETVRLQAQLTQARLDALRTQLNPHFLFNTLNSVSALLERDPRGARSMIAKLSELLRYTLEESPGHEVPLRRELDVLEEYVDLMQIRFQDRLEVTIDAPDDTRDALVPAFLLQPIVENALKHGVAEQSGVGLVVVRSRRAGDDLTLVVTDNGPGPAGDAEGVGLQNTRERLRQLYGRRASLTLTSVEGAAGAEARIVLPYHRTPVSGASAS